MKGVIHLFLMIQQEDGSTVVSGRELHEFLEVTTRYNDWIKRMLGYGFAENSDFHCLLKKE